MARHDCTSPLAMLQRLIPRAEVERRAVELGFIRRQRKVEAFVFVAAVLAGVVGRGRQSLAGMRRQLVLLGGPKLARSAFWDRFTVRFEALISWLLKRAEVDAAKPPSPGSRLVAKFKDIVAVDATVVKVHDALVRTWRGTRGRSAPAALKVHTWVRALTGELLQHRITAETKPDGHVLGVDWDATGKLFLFDRGYPAASLWSRIDRVGAYFLTRLPRSYKTRILAENRRHPGRARKLEGLRLWKALEGLRRSIVDVDGQFRVHVRGYAGGKGRYEHRRWRLVGVWDNASRSHHVYVTNLRPEMVHARDLPELYRLRWEVETFYKTAKSGLGLNELPSSKPHIVRTLVEAALLRASLAMQARYQAERRLPAHRWCNPHMWTRLWRQVLLTLLDGLLRPAQVRPTTTWEALASLAVDPNRHRPPTRWRHSVDLYEFQGLTICHRP